MATRMQRSGSTARSLAAWLLMAAVASVTARAEGVPARPSFDEDVQPLLKARCIKCHGPVKPKGKLNLSNARSVARGGETGEVVAPGSLEESTLWEQVAGDEMPPKPEEPLSRPTRRRPFAAGSSRARRACPAPPT